MTFCCQYHSPIGVLTLTSDGESLTGLWMDSQPVPADMLQQDLPVFDTVRKWLDAYFLGKNPPFSGLPLSPSGSDFQKTVWDILLTIPYGETVTYGHIAGMLSENMSAQAVGGAVGRNPISIIIPCHRCVGANGKLTGYAGGIDKKAWLLRHEGWLKEEET